MILAKYYPVTSHTDQVGIGSTFVAVKGMKEDGLHYIAKALEAGATTIVVEEGASLSQQLHDMIHKAGAVMRIVPSARLALAELSAQAYNYPAQKMKIIGITGTKGKTTTSFLIEHLLRSAGYKTALLSTVKNKILDTSFEASLTTAQPDYLHMFLDIAYKAGVEYVVMEVAAQAMTLHRLATIQFDTVLFTNFSLEHSEFYTSQDAYFKAKCSLFGQLAPQGLALLNADDKKVIQAVSAEYGNSLKQPVFFSLHKNSDMYGVLKKSDLTGLVLDIQTKKSCYSMQSSNLLGDFSASNILAAVGVAERYGVDRQTIEDSLATFVGVPGRLQRFVLPNGAIGVIDNAHTPSSFEAILSAVRPLSNHIIAIFGAGGDRDPIKRPLMGALAAHWADVVFLTTDNPRSEDPVDIIDQIKKGIDSSLMHKVHVELDREKAVKQSYAFSRPGTLILLLGKGPVEYQHIKEVKIPFSEAAILREL